MDRDELMRWVAGYEQAWRDGDRDAVTALFTEDAHYRTSPYAEAEVGHAAIRALWLRDQGETFTVRAEPVAVEGREAVVRLEVRYGDPVRQEYRDLWVLRFAADGRVEDFEEWYWPAPTDVGISPPQSPERREGTHGDLRLRRDLRLPGNADDRIT